MASFRSELVQLGRPDVCIHVSLSEPAGTGPPAPDESAPTIVFLHYWGGSTRTWAAVAARVAAADRTVSIDFRGWGRSTGPDDAAAYSMRALAEDVGAVLVQLRQRGVVVRIVLVGLSMGAKVAQVVAAHSQLAMAGVVLAGVVLASPAPATPLQLPPDMQEQQLHAYDSAASATFVARNVLTESFRDESTRLPDFFVEDMLRGNRWARAAWPAYGMAEDVTGTSLSRPDAGSPDAGSPDAGGPAGPAVLVLAAERDVVEPLERVRRGVHALIPGAELGVVAASGHLSPIDAPEAVAAAILRFVDKAAKGTAP